LFYMRIFAKSLHDKQACKDWVGNFEKRSSCFAKATKTIDLGHRNATKIDPL
jgi:hypothetical protein